MYDRISGLSTPPTQAVEPSQSVNSDSFMETVADLSLRRTPLPGDLPDMGCCASKPNFSDPNNPSTSGPVRPNAPLFEYRTAELADANVEGICVGLTAEWLGNLQNSPRSRMTALTPGSDGHDSAAVWQQRYLDIRGDLRKQGAEPPQANSDAKCAMLQEAGLQPSQREKVYSFDDPASISRMLGKITADGSRYLLSLKFVEGGRHTVATSTFDGTTTLFDPNYGEFSVPSDQVDSLLQRLADRYIDPNGLYLKSIATRKMS
ncbi:C58 family peptidase [Bradyrhizobium sp. WSM 1738]|uniref:YopT-type cysteine protease domain-containing protein n=1 Tax=Bradyrhizobium hereditatis TaxID=2821405 RepID=UPI001CE2A284|nr:YopT-type cysteine protease domain-containing protein [Bradyrhizobium hereditatis]MCA6116850.1 C58 family peptidase [Bradyrhizobium hereditatis]